MRVREGRIVKAPGLREGRLSFTHSAAQAKASSDFEGWEEAFVQE